MATRKLPDRPPRHALDLTHRHRVGLKLPQRTLGAPPLPSGSDDGSVIETARAWCKASVANEWGWHLWHTPETCYVQFARAEDAALFMLFHPGGRSKRLPVPRPPGSPPRRSPWLDARLALAAAARATADAKWEAEEQAQAAGHAPSTEEV